MGSLFWFVVGNSVAFTLPSDGYGFLSAAIMLMTTVISDSMVIVGALNLVYHPHTTWRVLGALAASLSLLTVLHLLIFLVTIGRKTQRSERRNAVEGELKGRLGDSSLRLLSTPWLMQQGASYVLRRRQELPEEAFVSPAVALNLLHRRRMAVLSCET